MPTGFPEKLDLLPANWPNEEQAEDQAKGPGSEAGYLPQGFLLGAPNVVFPYRGMASDDYYGAQEHSPDPFKNAPLQDSCGGTVYFETTNKDNLTALINAIGVNSGNKDYGAFAFSSTDTINDRYLDQLKIVTHSAMISVFEIESEILPPKQRLTILEAMIDFVAAQADKWNHPTYTFSPKLTGTAGGDGDWAKEALAFGIHVENSYWGGYRIWSRPWLVTK